MTTPERIEWKGAAAPENLDALQALVEKRLETAGVPIKTRMQLAIVVEEVFVNIAYYAFAPRHGRGFGPRRSV